MISVLKHLPDRKDEMTFPLVFDLGEGRREVQTEEAERSVKPQS